MAPSKRLGVNERGIDRRKRQGICSHSPLPALFSPQPPASICLLHFTSAGQQIRCVRVWGHKWGSTPVLCVCLYTATIVYRPVKIWFEVNSLLFFFLCRDINEANPRPLQMVQICSKHSRVPQLSAAQVSAQDLVFTNFEILWIFFKT